MGITVHCPQCGMPEEVFHPIPTAEGFRGMIDPDGTTPCSQCGMDLAKLMHNAQRAALAPVRRKKQLKILAVVALAVACIVAGQAWRDISGLRLWSDIHNYLKANAKIKFPDDSNQQMMN